MGFEYSSRRLVYASCVVAALSSVAFAQTTSRASLSETSGQLSLATTQARISGNGRYVAFVSAAPSVVSAQVILGSESGLNQIYRRDLLTGQTVIVSAAANSAGNGESFNPRISDDGRFISFSTVATNLGPMDLNNVRDVYVRDMQTGTIVIASLAYDGAQGDLTSDSSAIWANSDGSSVIVAFRSEATNLIPGGASASQVYLRNLAANTTSLVSAVDGGILPGNGDSGRTQISISANGTRVSFGSSASNLIANDQNGTVTDIFVRDIATQSTILISKATNGLQGSGPSYSNAISSNGNLVAFSSINGLVNNDVYGSWDVFVRDIALGTTTRVSVDPKGRTSNGQSGSGEGWGIAISGNGRYVAFQSTSTNLISGDTNAMGDVFVRDRQTNKTTAASVTSLNKVGNGESTSPTLSNDGLAICFISSASNLVAGDTNGVSDAFARK